MYGENAGVFYNADYPYTAREGACMEHSMEPAVNYRLGQMEPIVGGLGEAMKEWIVDKLENGPMTLGIRVGCAMFWSYGGGTIRREDCPESVHDAANHEVSLIGYYPPSEEPFETYVHDRKYNERHRDDYDPEGGCRNEGEWYLPEYDSCAWYSFERVTFNLEGEVGTFVLHNSWGTGWGVKGVFYIGADFAEDHYGPMNISREFTNFTLEEVNVNYYADT